MLGSLGLCIATIAIATAAQLSAFHIQDDAYMYARYADNLLHDGQVVWNHGGSPAYGASSLLYLVPVAILRAMLPDSPALALALGSLLCGGAALVSIVVLAWRASEAGTKAHLPIALLVILPIAGAGEFFATHMGNGMDTCEAILALAILLLAWTGYQRSPTRGRVWILGVCGGLVYLARPELALFALIVPFVVALLSRGEDRKRAAEVFAISALMIGAELGLAYAYFGEPLPLSFYMKSSWRHAYGESFRARYVGVGFEHLRNFLTSYWIWFALIGAGVVFEFRSFARNGGALRVAVLAATVADFTYHTFFVTQIVGYAQRFYYPTLPALVMLAAWSAVAISKPFVAYFTERPLPYSRPVQLMLALVACKLMVPPLVSAVRRAVDDEAGGKLATFDIHRRVETQSARFWYALERISALPDEIVIATTEVGHPAALNPRKMIVDIAGLNEPEFALAGFSADRLFGVIKPDVVYMPHPDYAPIVAQMRAYPTFAAEYREFTAEELDAYMGIAVRRNSAHYNELCGAIEQTRVGTVAALPVH